MNIDPRDLHFGLMNLNAAHTFRAQRGADWCVVPMHDSVYVGFLDGAEAPYVDFVNAYLGGDSTTAARAQWMADRIARFRQTAASIKKDGVVTAGSSPITVFQSMTGNWLVHDGHHRSAIACAIGLDSVPVSVIPREHVLKHFARIPDLVYGSGYKGEGNPYQAFYYGDQLVLAGVRFDVRTRHELIGQHVDFTGRSLVDFGSNYGNASFLALQDGAVDAHLVELEPSLLAASIHLGLFSEARGAHYHLHDLRTYCDAVPVCDIGYCFSVTSHVHHLAELGRMMRDKVREVLLYESHQRAQIEPEIAALFAKVSEIGRLPGPAGVRILYKCSK